MKIKPRENFEMCSRVIKTLFLGGFSISEVMVVMETKNRHLIETMLRNSL